MTISTIREILVQAEQKYGAEDAVRYKTGKDTIEAKSYTDLKQDSEHFSGALEELGVRGGHVAVTGMTSYPWLVTGVNWLTGRMQRCWWWMKSERM